MTLRDFIRGNRAALDEAILTKVPNLGRRLNDEDRAEWVRNDEDLYRWALAEGVKQP